MSQLQISKQRRMTIARRRDQEEQLPLDPRDPDITRAKQLQRRLRQPRAKSMTSPYVVEQDEDGAWCASALIRPCGPPIAGFCAEMETVVVPERSLWTQ